MHTTMSPAILYWGSIVVLISTENEDGTTNVAPISSAWWLGHRCMLGLAAASQTTINLLRTKQCVLNLPSSSMGDTINALACVTGTETVPPGKAARGYCHVKDKLALANLTAQPSDLVRAPRVRECPVQMEAVLAESNILMKDVPDRKGMALALEVKILRVYVEEELHLAGYENRIDADKWRPMIMSFQDLYGLAAEKAVESKLAKVPEESYRPLTRSESTIVPGVPLALTPLTLLKEDGSNL